MSTEKLLSGQNPQKQQQGMER